MSRSTWPTRRPSPNQLEGERDGRRARLLPLFLSVVVALFAAGLVALFGRRFTRYAVTGASMEPALHDGDWLIIDTRAYRHALPHPGDIVVANDPRCPERAIVKRVDHTDPALGLIWLYGDNRDESTDSRHFGPLAPDQIVGHVRWRYWRFRSGEA